MLIRCLGHVGVLHVNGETALSQSQRRIVAILTAAGPEGISSDRFADELWGEDLSPSWQASVRKSMSRTRKVLGVGGISMRNGRYSLDLATDEIDIWKLLAVNDLDVAAEPEQLIQHLLSGEPYADIEPSPLLRQQLEAIAAARLHVLEEMIGHPWSAATLLATRTLVIRSHYRNDFLVAVAELHINADEPGTAKHLLEMASSYAHVELGAEPSPRATALLAGLSSTAPSTDESADREREVAAGRVVGIFDTTKDPGGIERADITSTITRAVQGPGSLVTGDSGAGKSALMQSIVLNLASEGHHVLWLRGQYGSPTAYAPFLAGLPSLEQDLAPLLSDGGNELLRAECWAAARRRIGTEFPGLPLLIVIDDAQWLDSHSQHLVSFLASTQTPSTPTLIVIGRDDVSARDWKDFSHGLAATGLTRIDVGAFADHELLDLIGLHHPAATSKQRHDFASTLLERRSALAAVARELIRSADPTTLALTDPHSGATRSKIWSKRVRAETQRIAAVAAVAGMRFRLPTVVDLSGLDIDTILVAIDELLGARLIIEEQRPDEFSFRHVLIHAEFDGVLDRGDRRRLHLDASQMARGAGDIHARAVHLVEAGALVDNEQIVAALLDSAHLFRAAGSYREAVQEFSQARQFADHELAVEDLLAFAAAIASSGGDGWDLRSEAFALAEERGDPDLCLDVALSGALRTEDAMGQTRRVEMLERIDGAELPGSRRAVYFATLARELGLLGMHDRSIAMTTNAVAEATSPDDRFVAWLGAWPSCRSLPPSEWPELPEDRDQITTAELVSRLAQVECARAFVLGEDATARARLRDFADDEYTRSDPLRRWHASLVGCAQSFVDGRWDDQRRQATAALEDAAQHGVIAAFSTRIAQEFALHWIVGQHGALLPQFDAAPPDVQTPLLARAAHAVTLAEQGEHRDRSRSLIMQLAQEAHAHRSPLSHSTAALLASAPERCVSSDAKHHLRAVLTPFLGTAIVAGAAITHFGPAAWSLANLADNTEDRALLLQQACDESDAWNLRVWSIVCRRDLAAITGDGAVLNEARSLAEGTPLAELL